MIGSQGAKATRVPRADKLNLARDILHLLAKHGNVLTINSLFSEIMKQFAPPKKETWKRDTFNEYMILLQRLKLARVATPIVRILEPGKSLVQCSTYGEEELDAFESQIFKSLLLSYLPFRNFLSVSFCGGESFSNEQELFERAKCPSRADLLKAYMKAHQQKDDREPRIMLYWGMQIGLIESDGYHDNYFLVNPRKMDSDTFLHQLFQAYDDARDLKTGMALIPEVRFRSCCALKISRDAFDQYLIRLFNERPTTIELGRGSTSRKEVVKYGITDNRNYYYYIRLGER